MPVPDDWFLEAATIGGFRTPFTVGNAVSFLVDGQSYMTHLADRLDALAPGDQLLLSGWRFSPEQRLRPEVAGSSGIQDRLIQLVNTGVVVRVLEFGSAASTAPVRMPQIPALPSKDNADFRDALAAGGATAVLDSRLGRFASHHQKFAVVRGTFEGPWAYVGGIDLCLDRWDTPSHASPAARQREPVVVGQEVSQPGWHDVQCGIRGPAIRQIWDSFRDRWNDPTQPNPFAGVPSKISANEAPSSGPSGGHAVQVLRTLTCNGVYSFLPNGERTVEAGYRKAIKRAERFIYIEDQYVWPSPIVGDLHDAAARGVQIVIVTSRDFDVPILSIVHKSMRAEALMAISSAAPGNVRVFHLERAGSAEQIYVHAKLMIVDDIYAAIGSANINFRSHTTDSELHLGIFDTDLVDGNIGGVAMPVGRSVRDLRCKLWGEHLQQAPASLDDPIQALSILPAPGTKKGHLVGRALPTAGIAVDYRDVLRQMLRALQQMAQWQVLAAPFVQALGLNPLLIPPWQIPGFDLGRLADLVPDPEPAVRGFLNPNTICP